MHVMKTNIGLNIPAPKGKCSDAKCAWHGSLPIRGKVFRGTVRSAKAHHTAIIEFGYMHFHYKYERYERRNSRIAAHNPECMKAKEGDSVVIAECRPLSRTKKFVVVGIEEAKGR